MYEKIVASAKSRGLTQKALCARFGWQANRLSLMKSGHVKIRLDELKAIALELGVSPAWLIDDEAPDDPSGASVNLTDRQKWFLTQIEMLGEEEAQRRLLGVSPGLSWEAGEAELKPVPSTAKRRKQG